MWFKKKNQMKLVTQGGSFFEVEANHQANKKEVKKAIAAAQTLNQLVTSNHFTARIVITAHPEK